MFTPAMRKFSSFVPKDILPSSSKTIFRADGTVEVFKPRKRSVQAKKKRPPEEEYRENEVKIQMLSSSLHRQIFGTDQIVEENNSSLKIQQWCDSLRRHNLNLDSSPKFKDVNLVLPPIEGQNIIEHFRKIAEQQVGPYRPLIDSLLLEIPEAPKEWSMEAGWTKYTPKAQPIPFPDADALIFDIEVSVKSGNNPVMACAVSKDYWYSWVSPSLLSVSAKMEGHRYRPEELIPLESDPGETKASFLKRAKTPKIIVGHNVSYDRARVKEQYLLEQTALRFLDTMSLHTCVSGVTSYQRAILKANKEPAENDLFWTSQTSLNSLVEVYRLYCGQALDKEARDIFVEGTLAEVKENFQMLMRYCSGDVRATQSVFKQLFPLFAERFPHPATLAGMLEIGTAYLPVNSNWTRYINESNLTYEDLDIESRYLLAKRADQACHLMHDEQYKRDLWMWDQDWSTQAVKLKAAPKKSSKTEPMVVKEEQQAEAEEDELTRLEKRFEYLFQMQNLLPARKPFLSGYPAWYRKLCSKTSELDWTPGPINLSTGMQVTPKLLSLCWEGYPLHYIMGHGWGFLVPYARERPDGVVGKIPLEELLKKCPLVEPNKSASANESELVFAGLWKTVEQKLSKKDYYERVKKDQTGGRYRGTGVWCNLELEESCWFLKLPHKDGPTQRVGNPLAKDFITKFSENVLTGDAEAAERVIEIARMLSYWRNNRDRIAGQMVVWLNKKDLPRNLQAEEQDFGAIIPQVVVCGTLTRRAIEPTWMTASNAREQRVGSELRAMVQAPPGYRIVGADVDSQELWIASVLGDAYAAGIHGATPLGWMTISGTKSDASDMHSVTARAIGISRDHAKVINYARIYGAGQQFSVQLLKQFNPTISDGEAKSKAMKMFMLTKGRKVFRLLPEYREEHENRAYRSTEALSLARSHGLSVPEMFGRARWEGGTESAMFNRLEEIAESEKPLTPFLEGRLSRALEPQPGTEDRFLPTRINWVVQSGAVDFLHLMLVCMRWLMGDQIRYCLSFHDEVRYLVPEKYAYQAALAMHVTNLLTRSFCSARLNLYDLPQSVAFFGSVEVDTVLRKEATMDCKTPSNPHGLASGYGVPEGESLDIHTAIEKAGGEDLNEWKWLKRVDQ